MIIKDKERKLLRELCLRKISYDDFIAKFPFELDDNCIISILEELTNNRDGELLDFFISLCYYRDSFLNLCRQFCDILLETWHEEHEEIARIFQFKLDCQCSIDAIEKSIYLKHDYLLERGDYEPFVVKCMYAIASLDNLLAKNALVRLSQSSELVIQKAAKFQIDRLG